MLILDFPFTGVNIEFVFINVEFTRYFKHNVHLFVYFIISEAGFSQRERLSLQKCEEELTQKFHEKIEQERKSLQEENTKKIEKLKFDQNSQMQTKLCELDKLQKTNIESMVQKATSDLRKKFEQDRENALKTQQQQLTMKAKRDIEALRKRFKMMQTTGALERSPSCSESSSELSIEVLITNMYFLSS